MPQDETDSTLVCDKVDDWVVNVAVESDVWYLPDLDRAVLGRTGDDRVIVWTPLDVEHSCTVTSHQWRITVYPTYLHIQHSTAFILHPTTPDGVSIQSAVFPQYTLVTNGQFRLRPIERHTMTELERLELVVNAMNVQCGLIV